MITDSRIAFGDMLGAQMNTYAGLYYIAKENNQKLVFWEELRHFRRGLLIFDAFELPEQRMQKKNRILSTAGLLYGRYLGNVQKKNWRLEMNRIYHSAILTILDSCFLTFVQKSHKNFKTVRGCTNGVHCDQRLLKLKKHFSYDIHDGFGTYRDWCKYQSEILREFQFKKDIMDYGKKIWKSLHIPKEQETVSIHFRRTDYLQLSSLNVSFDYYRRAIGEFDDQKTIFLVFSDNINECRKFGGGLFDEKKHTVIYMPKRSASIDMYLMTLCSHNITANSSFSFWGAFLNPSASKKVVCPFYYVGEHDLDSNHLNGHYYPDEWTALKEI